jgi:hypothetical protein
MISHAVAAVQLNGPRLTRESLAKTYSELPPVGTSARESWAMVGDYSDPSRRSWPKAANVYWWDPDHVDADGGMGTYAYADCGQRFVLGQFPSRPAHIYTKTGYVNGPNFYSKCTPPATARAAPASAPLPQPARNDEVARPAVIVGRRTAVRR